MSLSHERVDPAPSGVGDSVDNLRRGAKEPWIATTSTLPTTVAQCVRKRSSSRASILRSPACYKYCEVSFSYRTSEASSELVIVWTVRYKPCLELRAEPEWAWNEQTSSPRSRREEQSGHEPWKQDALITLIWACEQTSKSERKRGGGDDERRARTTSGCEGLVISRIDGDERIDDRN